MMTPFVTIFAFTVFFLDGLITINGTNKGFIFYYFQKLFHTILCYNNRFISILLIYAITTVIRKTLPTVPVELLLITIMWLMQYTR